MEIQIHLMFLFIKCLTQVKQGQPIIQIHLMFLFIGGKTTHFLKLGLFKYISCSYLSHFLLNFYNYYIIFKYISCSYLSRKHYYHKYHLQNSNTSHVLIYLVTIEGVDYQIVFKYISCSYLSEAEEQRKLEAERFKYISCSYLSGYD